VDEVGAAAAVCSAEGFAPALCLPHGREPQGAAPQSHGGHRGRPARHHPDPRLRSAEEVEALRVGGQERRGSWGREQARRALLPLRRQHAPVRHRDALPEQPVRAKPVREPAGDDTVRLTLRAVDSPVTLFRAEGSSLRPNLPLELYGSRRNSSDGTQRNSSFCVSTRSTRPMNVLSGWAESPSEAGVWGGWPAAPPSPPRD